MQGEQVDVVVVGAGLAGLSAARHLHAAGLDVLVVERSDGVGGRVRTDVRDGFRLDRGFQLFNPAYPEPPRLLDLEALDLRMFARGALVFRAGRRHRLADPRTEPLSLARSAAAPVGSLRAKASLGALALRDGYAPVSALIRDDTTARASLTRWGVTGDLADHVVGRFLAGVFLEPELATSSRFLHLVLRTFVRGTPCVPATGMGRIPEQLAAGLGVERVRLETPVIGVDGDTVRLAGGACVRSRLGVVVATDAVAARALLPELSVPASNGVTTFYHATSDSPVSEPILLLDGEEELILNSVVLTAAAPDYAPPGLHLVSTSVLGTGHGVELEPHLRSRLATLYGADTRAWDHLASYEIPAALPQMLPPFELRRSVRLARGRYVCGDHRDTSSIQGAMVSGRRAARALLADAGLALPA